jgi:ABC-type antimicrobial peptide transport system permease subunit
MLGLAGSFAITRVMANLLVGVTPTDPVTFAFMAAGLIVVAMLASYLPARRATRINPLQALRTE